MQVKVSFLYTPSETDEDDPTGVSEADYERVTEVLMMSLGAEDIEFEKVES